MAYSFRGGIHPGTYADPGVKSATSTKPIEKMPAPDCVILPVSMHIGAPASPAVQVGEIVDMGQVVAETEVPTSVPVHATVSGKVIAMEPLLHPNGARVLSIVIENDQQDRLHASVHPCDFESMSNEERIEHIRTGGIVGHGGAAFPTYIKIRSALGKVDTVIVNGAECEPYITSDHRLLLEHPEEVVEGLRMIVKMLGVCKALIGIEENKCDTFAGIQKLIAGDTVIKLCPLKCQYPQGAEKQLINALTGREVPNGKLPADAGCAVFNTDTVRAVYRRFAEGMPMIRRIVTVSGSAIVNPKNLEVRIGTPVEKLIDECEGFKEPPNKLLMGGPMMGIAQYSLDVPVVKGTNAFLAFCGEEDKRVEKPECIRCGRCIRACPMRLMPIYMNVFGKADETEDAVKAGVLDCIECGSCAYVCPARIPLVQQFRLSKARILEARGAAQRK